jgi:CRP-like cAMP-binding protein
MIVCTDGRKARPAQAGQTNRKRLAEVHAAGLFLYGRKGIGIKMDDLFNELLANFGKEGRPEPIVGKFSQETLAEMIGTTRSRVSFFMNKFRKLGFIEYNGKLEVHNSLLNVVLHDNPQLRRDAGTPA